MTQQVYEDVLSYAIIVLTRYTTHSQCTSFETAPSRRTRSAMGQNLSLIYERRREWRCRGSKHD